MPFSCNFWKCLSHQPALNLPPKSFQLCHGVLAPLIQIRSAPARNSVPEIVMRSPKPARAGIMPDMTINVPRIQHIATVLRRPDIILVFICVFTQWFLLYFRIDAPCLLFHPRLIFEPLPTKRQAGKKLALTILF